MIAGIALASWSLAEIQGAKTVFVAQNRLLVTAEHLLSTVKDIETGVRGYALTGSPAYLEPYDAALAELPAALAGVQAGPDTGRLAALVQAKLAFARRVLVARRDGGRDSAIALVMTGQDKALMDQVRSAVAELQRDARARIARSDRQEAAREPFLVAAAILSTLVAFAAIALIAVRRRREERASRDLLGSVLDNAPLGLGFLDADLRVRHMNQTLAAMSERVLDGGLGRSLWEMLPDMREVLQPRLRAVLGQGRVVTGVQVAARARDTHRRQHDYEFGFFPLPSQRETGQGGGAGLVVSDVTTRKRAERRLRDSEERYRTLIQTSAAIVWTTPPTGLFEGMQASWTAFTGQAAAACEGLGWLEVVHPDDRDAVRAGWTEVVATHAMYAAEYRLMRADGEWRAMAVHAVPILDEGEVREWVGTHTDITEQRRNEEELTAAKESAEAANRAKSQFLANMSHELRTPLSAVIGYSEMIEEEMEETGETHLLGDVQKIQSNARHLLSLINDVLDLSKIEADKMTTYGETFPVDALVRDVAATVGALVTQKDNTLALDLGDDLGEIYSDQTKLRQCLFNLVSNAAKFTKDGRITLRAAREGDQIVLSVTDTGIGMTPEQLARLFERFSQADVSTTRQFGGTGLGLALTRAFCRLLGGDVQVTSVFNEGSTFTMTIPAHMPEQAAEPVPDPGAKAATQHVVLVIDDDAGQRDLLSRFLEREGFAVRTAPDGRAGMELARALHPRAILLDVMMPHMDGWSVLSALKADPELAAIPVVMVTFVNEPGLGLSLGAADTVLKPVEWNRLRTVMERFQGDAGDILVVDDDPDARARVRSVLEHDGWTVSEAADGRAALDMVAHAPPQLILLDLTMPVMDGFAFLHALRQRPGCEDIPVVVLTARDLDPAERQRLDGADRVLSKGQTDLRALSGELRALAPPAG